MDPLYDGMHTPAESGGYRPPSRSTPAIPRAGTVVAV